MCGIFGTFSSRSIEPRVVDAGLAKLASRGPDGQGRWQEDGVVMAHTRLAIIDLDPRAAQPMHSTCGRYVIVFNGEIYNYRELRHRLEKKGTEFRTSSDTEVLLALFAAEGEGMVASLRGMFAFAIWDRVAKRAFLARDPYGIKPLYVGTFSDGVVIASQVRAIMATGLVAAAPDPRGQAGYWLLGSVPEPHTWYRDVQAIGSGTSAWIEDSRLTRQRSFHDIGDRWRAADELPISKRSRSELHDTARAAMKASVAAHLVADVPVGLFLSSGIDSGVLGGLMAEESGARVRAVTLQFGEFANTPYDETPAARAIAERYGLEHHVRQVTAAEFEEDLPRIMAAMDQPSVDGINTWYATKAATELGLKAVVSGVGGDELFQGYESFRTLPRLVRVWSAVARVPGVVPVARAVLEVRARRTSNFRWRHAADWSRTMAGAWFLRRGLFAPDDLPHLMGRELAEEGLQEFSPGSWVASMCGALPQDSRLALSLIESKTYLRNQLLRDSDWASMDHGVELRTPLVDAWLLAELAPVLKEIGGVPGKGVLAATPQTPLPADVVHRRKTGFAIPIKRWLEDRGRAACGGGSSNGWARYVATHYAEAVA